MGAGIGPNQLVKVFRSITVVPRHRLIASSPQRIEQWLKVAGYRVRGVTGYVTVAYVFEDLRSDGALGTGGLKRWQRSGKFDDCQAQYRKATSEGVVVLDLH